jgi:hypothetical protein
LGFNAYRMRSAEAIGKHWCLVFVAYSLLHLTCLPVLLQKTKSRIFVPWKLLIFQYSIFRFSLKHEFLQQNRTRAA